MSFLDSLRYRLRVLVHPDDHERELAEEVDFHLGLEAMQRSHAARGELSTSAAGQAARRRFGNVTYYREETRQTAGLGALDALRQDLRYALRSFRRTPTFTAIAVLTLAIGIGANTAIYSAVDAMLLRPLPFAEPDRLMDVALTIPPRGDRPARDDALWSHPKFLAMRQSQSAFASLTPWLASQFTVRIDDEATRAEGEFVDGRYLPTLGIRPALGRNFLPDEERPAGPHVAIIGDAFWRHRLSADPHVLGRSFDIDGTSFTIIGVMPPGFAGLSGEAGFWIPISPAIPVWTEGYARDPYNHVYRVVGRLRPGASAAAAVADIVRAGRLVDATYPSPIAGGGHWGATARPLDATRADPMLERSLFILFGAVGLVLLIACANVANLLLVRAAGRRREIAVRLAIGAGRGRLVRQLLTESLLLSTLGGLAGVLIAWWGVASIRGGLLGRALPVQSGPGLGLMTFATIRLDLSALAFTAALALATGLVFGLVPAFQATRPRLTEALKEKNPSQSGGLRGLTSRNALVVVEIALSVVLLAGSGLMLRSLGELLGVRPGFDAEHVLTMRVNRAPAWARDSISQFYDLALARLAALPGVTAVAMADCPPVSGGCGGRTGIMLHDRPLMPRGTGPVVDVHWATPGWMSVMHVPLVRGRAFTEADRPDRQHVVLVSETTARTLWPNADPIGRPVTVDLAGNAFGSDTAYVAGVVGDVHFRDMRSPPGLDVYVPYHQAPISFRMMFFLRTRGDPLAVAAAARQALREVAPGFPVHDVATMERRVAGAVDYMRSSATLLGLFAAVALGLATMGTYGVISFGVSQRTREIGVRLALGATRRDVVRLVVGQGVTLAAVGATCGIIGALAATRVLRSMLYGVEPSDPLTLAGIIAMLLLAVLVACWVPARRAAGVPAVQALRGD